VQLWNPQTGKKLRTLKGHAAGIGAIAFSPDGQTLASGSDDQTIKLWQVKQ
jgi:WD40 repeat protein